MTNQIIITSGFACLGNISWATSLGTIDHAPLLVGSTIFLVASHVCSSLNTPLKYVQSQVARVGFDFATINCPLLIFASMFSMVEGDLSPISIIVILSVEVQNLVRMSLAFEVVVIRPIPKLVIIASWTTTGWLYRARKLTLASEIERCTFRNIFFAYFVWFNF